MALDTVTNIADHASVANARSQVHLMRMLQRDGRYAEFMLAMKHSEEGGYRADDEYDTEQMTITDTVREALQQLDDARDELALQRAFVLSPLQASILKAKVATLEQRLIACVVRTDEEESATGSRISFSDRTTHALMST